MADYPEVIDPLAKYVIDPASEYVDKEVLEPAWTGFASEFPRTANVARKAAKATGLVYGAKHAIKLAKAAKQTAHKVNKVLSNRVDWKDQHSSYPLLMADREQQAHYDRMEVDYNRRQQMALDREHARARAALRAIDQIRARRGHHPGDRYASRRRMRRHSVARVVAGFRAAPGRRPRAIRKLRQRGVGWRYTLGSWRRQKKPSLKTRLLHKKHYLRHSKK